jgi:hypothetical protein
MHSIVRTFFALIFFIVTSCSSQTRSDGQPSSIHWEDLQVTPQPNGGLCPDISARQEPSWEEAKREAEYGIFSGIYPADETQTRKIGDSTFSVEANKSQMMHLRLWYPEGNERSANLRMFSLLDDRQLTDAINAQGSYYDIELEKGSDTLIPLKIPPLAPGVHDVITIAIPYPQEYPNPEGIVVVIAWRITLIVSPSDPLREIDFVSFPREGIINQGDPLLYLELSLKQNKLDVWNWPNPWLDIDTNSPINFFALAGHNHVNNLDAPPLEDLKESFFALLFFIDDQQIEIVPGQRAIYGKVNQDTAYTRIPVEIAPLPEGKHKMLVLRIDSPGVPVCVLKGDPSGRILPHSIYGKLVGINVLPPK